MKKTWEKMTRSERKVAVAKDVKAHILAKSFKVKQGTYLNINKDIEELPNSQLQAQCLLSAKKDKCEACARGAMMLCKVAKWNNWDDRFNEYIEQWDTSNALSDAFDDEELDLIECFFEQSAIFSSLCCTEEFVKKYGADPYTWGPNDAEDRLLCIMQNIIDHGGDFKPEVEYEIKKA